MTAVSRQFGFQFSGREKEQVDLERILDKALCGEGSLAFITGESGIGKSRLAQEISEKGKQRGFTCLAAKSPKGGSLLPYSVWVDLLRQLTTRMSVQSFFDACGNFTRQILKLLPELGVARNRPTSRVTVSERKHSVQEFVASSPVQIFDAITQFFYRLSSQSPIMILLDDLQWCDHTSLDLLRYFTGSSFRTRQMVVLCCYRDAYLEIENPGLFQLVSDFSTSERIDEIISLKRFDLTNTKKLIQNAIGLGHVPEALCETLYKKTGGNPFFVRELLALLVETSIAGTDPTVLWQSTDIQMLEVPNTVEEVVKQRLAPIEDELVEVLRVAALIGEDFDISILYEATNIGDKSHLFELLQTATKTGIVTIKGTQHGRLVYSFEDEILMDVLTENLTPERLLSYHQAIGQIMELSYLENIDERSGDVALHFQKGVNWQKCFEYSTKAGDYAASRNAHEEASKYYTMALESSDKLRGVEPMQSRGQTLERLGDELGMLGRPQASFQTWEEALRAYKDFGNQEKAATLHRKMGWRYAMSFVVKGSENKALEHYEAALVLLEQNPRGPTLAFLYHHLATWYWYYGESAMARSYCEKSIRIAKDFGIPEIEALSNQILGFTSRIEDFESAMELFRKSEQLAENSSSPEFDLSGALGRAEWCLGLAYRWAADNTLSSIAYFVKAVNTSEKISNVATIHYYRGTLALWGYLPAGEWSKAKNEVLDSLAWPSLGFFPAIQELVYGVLGIISLREGELDKAEEWLLKGYAASCELQGLVRSAFVSSFHTSLARLFMDRDNYVRAESFLLEGYAILKKRGIIIDSAKELTFVLELLVEVCEKQEKRQEAVTFLDELQDIMKLANQDWARAYFYQAEGFMATEMEEWDRALREYEESAKYWTVLARPYELARVYNKLALLHQSMGNTDSANRFFENAQEIFEKLGAKRDVSRVLSGKSAGEDMNVFSITRLRGSAKESSRSIFDYLVASFIVDYYSKKSPSESSGWRTLVDISKQTKIPKSAFYLHAAKDGGGLAELERMGLIEVRLYTGERGRGGKITRARISCDKQEIKNYVLRRMRKTSRIDAN